MRYIFIFMFLSVWCSFVYAAGVCKGLKPNGVVETYVLVIGGPSYQENCDDGNTATGDGCTNSCNVESGWTCSGTLGSKSVCQKCGNKKIEGTETCDDGNSIAGDGCYSCQLECGNGTLDKNEVCDDGNRISGDYCSADCKSVSGFCGDLTVQSNEKCDDGNITSGDYCSADCKSVTGYCGDGTKQINEECDNGSSNSNTSDKCRTGCHLPACGDGILDTGEVCDDGNTVNNDDCSNSCQLPSCGDGVANGSEECDGSTLISCAELEDFIYSDYTSGYASCKSDCTWDVSSCVKPSRNKFVGVKHFAYNYKSTTSFPATASTSVTSSELKNQSGETLWSPSGWQADLKSYKGYYFDLPPDTMIIGSPVYFKDSKSVEKIYFVTYTKEKRTASSTCDQNFVSGWSYLWEINAFNGLSTGGAGRGEGGVHWWVDDRVKAYLGRGISSEPTFSRDSNDGSAVLLMGTSGDSTPDSEIEGPLHKPSLTPPPPPDTPGAIVVKLEDPAVSHSVKILWWKIL